MLFTVSAEEGAELLRGHHVDLIILDISLPGRSGVAWLKDLRDKGFSGEVKYRKAEIARQKARVCR